MLLNAENLLDLQWWRLWWRRRGAENMNRRVLLVHVAVKVWLITCVWRRIGQAARHSTPVRRGTGV